MVESEKFKKMLERAEHTLDKEGVAELVSVVQELMPEIEDGMKKQLELYYAHKHQWMARPMLLKEILDMVYMKYKLRFGSVEGLFLIFSAVAWHYHHITVEINMTKEQCLAFWFRPGSENSEEPSVESCAEKWKLLYQEA